MKVLESEGQNIEHMSTIRQLTSENDKLKAQMKVLESEELSFTQSLQMVEETSANSGEPMDGKEDEEEIAVRKADGNDSGIGSTQ